VSIGEQRDDRVLAGIELHLASDPFPLGPGPLPPTEEQRDERVDRRPGLDLEAARAGVGRVERHDCDGAVEHEELCRQGRQLSVRHSAGREVVLVLARRVPVDRRYPER
jgi:hypothetical protein